MEYTNEQKNVVENNRDNILVAAAAGSGKTTSMVGRIIHEILNKGLSIDRMLVVTFTVDAAAHMLEKLEASLKKAAQEAKTRGDMEVARLLSAQIDLLPSCYIQTFDSFCARVIKEKGYCIADGDDAELFEPGNIVLDENIGALLQHAAADLAVQEAAFNSTEGDDFSYLSRRFGDGRSDNSLLDFINSCYDTLRSIPDYLDEVDRFVAIREERDSKGELHYADDEESPLTMAVDHLRKIREGIFGAGGARDFYYADPRYYITTKTNKNRDGYDQAREADELLDWISDYLDSVISVCDSDADIQDKIKAVARARELKDFSIGPISRSKDLDIGLMDKIYEPLYALFSFGADKCSGKKTGYELPPSCRLLLKLDTDNLLQAQKDGTRAIRALAGIIRRMDEIFASSKALIHGMDFNDQEHAAHAIVKQEEAATFYRDKFDEIFIDEYQDNTRLQDKIIELISRPEGNIFRVGDIKQSIYKFRHADPEMFASKMKQLEDPSKGKLLLLTENHRSTEEILSFVNFIFKQAMTEKGSEIEYDSTQRFNIPSDPEKVKNGPIPRVVLVDHSKIEDSAGNYFGDTGDGKNDAEDYEHMKPETKALCIGVESEVRHYLEMDGVELKDIYVLTTTKGKAETITNYLNDRGLKAAGRTTTSIFEDIDIHRLINFIISLGNELRDDYLVSVMLSNYSISNFSVKELGSLQAFFADKKHSEYLRAPLKVRLEQYAASGPDGELKIKVSDFINSYDDIRSQCMTMDIDGIIELIFAETNIKATVAAKEGDSSKLDFLKDWLASNFKRFGTDISGIADGLEEMKVVIKTDANIEIKDNDKNKITVMNVHKSKGLEFKYLIFALDDKDDKTDGVTQLMFDKNDGFIIDAYDYDKIARHPSFEQVVYQDKLKIASNAEKQRLLYVALTRAEKALSVVSAYGYGSKKNLIPESFANAISRASDYKGEKFDREYWLFGNTKMSYTFYSCIARASNSLCLTGLLSDETSVEHEVDYEDCKGNVLSKGFEFVLISDPVETKPDTVKIEDKGKDPLIELVQFDDKGKLKAGKYKYDSETSIPFKTSVTSFERNEGKIERTPHVDLEITPPSDFESIGDRLSAASKGTILHRIMSFIDLARIREHPEQLEAEIRELTDAGLFKEYGDENPVKVALEFEKGIVLFAESDVAAKLLEAEERDEAFAEKHILFAVPPVTEDSGVIEGSDGFALVQGIIDLIYKDNDGYVILDYKTDDLSGFPDKELRAAEAAKRHAFQLESYALACEASNMKVSRKLIYLVRYGQFIEV